MTEQEKLNAISNQILNLAPSLNTVYELIVWLGDYGDTLKQNKVNNIAEVISHGRQKNENVRPLSSPRLEISAGQSKKRKLRPVNRRRLASCA